MRNWNARGRRWGWRDGEAAELRRHRAFDVEAVGRLCRGGPTQSNHVANSLSSRSFTIPGDRGREVAGARGWRNRLCRRSETRQRLPIAIFGRPDGSE
jgi:hypothetical protein